MSSLGGEKQPKGKSKKTLTSKRSKSTKGTREGNVMVEKFRGDGVNFKCKLLGVAEVDGPRGDNMCIEAIKKLKIHQRQSGEHKMKIILNVTLMGIRILEEKTKNILFEHPVNKVSFITHDPDDKKIFSFISSAKCSAGNVGHMMYAIKYDKVAGIITSTLYDLFQAVFKLRQEGALKQRKAQHEPQPLPQNSLHQANSAVLTNGPSESVSSEHTNIYEEPNSTASIATAKELDEAAHYKVPVPRPLPPAPYSSASSQANHQVTESNGDLPNQAAVSSSNTFFSSSVFSSVDHPDDVSEASVDVTRKGSISSSVSSTSETASFDSRSLDLKSSAASCTPPSVPRARSTASSSGHPPTVTDTMGKPSVKSEIKPTPSDDDPDYDTISSTDYETIPSDIVTKTQKTEVIETKTSFGQFNFKESFGEDKSFAFETEKKSSADVDPHASELSLKKSEGSPPSSAIFGNNDDFFSSNFDDKTTSTHAPMSCFPGDDPFAPTSVNNAQESHSTNPFTSSDAFETAFGGEKVSPFEAEKNVDQPDENVKSPPKQDAFDTDGTFDSAFSATEMLPTVPTDKKFTDKESSSDDIQKDLPWSNVFGNDNMNNGQQTTSWAATFEDSEHNKSKDMGTKSDKREVSFSFNDFSGERFENEDEEDKSQQPDNVAAEPDFSWTGAFKEKSQQEVTFSWDDAFGGQTDSQQMSSEEGNVDKEEDRQTGKDFNAHAFDDAFSSTPFVPSKPHNDVEDKNDVAISMAPFDETLSPAKSNPPGREPIEQTISDIKPNDTSAVSDFNADFFHQFKSDKPGDGTNEQSLAGFDANSKNAFSKNDFIDVLSPQKPNSFEDEPREQSKVDVGNEEVGNKSGQVNPGSFNAVPKLTHMEDLDNMDKGKTELKEEPSNALSSAIPQIVEPGEGDSSNSEDEHVSTLPTLPTRTPVRKESPSAPPPLPPRPTRAPLPSLPPRPVSTSSPIVGQMPPIPPCPEKSSSSPASKTGTPKRVPPALPPRIDLQDGQVKTNQAASGPTMKVASHPFSKAENSWQADWTSGTSQNTEKGSDLDSKKSPDPFGDAFFTDFNFTNAAGSGENKSESVKQNNKNLFSDPFLDKEGSQDLFKADFGGVDPFADFASNKSTVDPFASDGGDVFSQFSTNDDPFLDSVDPFAEKVALSDDPFAVSPKKSGKDGTSALQLSKNSDDGDFADSFA